MYIFLTQGALAALDGVQRGLDAPSLVGWIERESKAFLRNFTLQPGQPHRGEKIQWLSPGVFKIVYWLVKNQGHHHGALTRAVRARARTLASPTSWSWPPNLMRSMKQARTSQKPRKEVSPAWPHRARILSLSPGSWQQFSSQMDGKKCIKGSSLG